MEKKPKKHWWDLEPQPNSVPTPTWAVVALVIFFILMALLISDPSRNTPDEGQCYDWGHQSC